MARPCCVTCRTVLLEPYFRNFLFRKVSEEFMGCVSKTLEVNWVLEENGPKNLTARHCNTTFQYWQSEGDFMGCMGTFRIRDSAVGIATGYGLDDRSSSPGRVKNLLFSTLFIPVLGSTQPPIQWVPGAFSLGLKRPGREADHSPSTSAQVKKMRIYTSTRPYAFMAQCLIS
jgi:hypothetical protein